MQTLMRNLLAGLAILLCAAMPATAAEDYGLAPHIVQRNGKWGLLRFDWGTPVKDSQPITAFEFDAIENWEYGDTTTFFKAGKAGLINRAGKIVVPAVYDYAWPFKNDMAIVFRDGKFGAVDGHGKLVVPTEYQWLTEFTKQGLATAIRSGEKYGVINKANHVVIPFEQVLTKAHDSGILALTPKLSVYTPEGKRFPMEQYQDYRVDPSLDALILYPKQGKGPLLVDWDGKPFFEGQFDSISYTEKQRIAVVRREQRYAAYDVKRRAWIFPNTYARIDVQDNGMLLVTEADGAPKVFFADREGRKLFNTTFDDSHGFKWGYAKVRVGDSWGLIDEKGRQIVPNDSYSADDIEVGKHWIAARGSNGWGVVDFQGKILMPFEFDGGEYGSDKRNPFVMDLSTPFQFSVVRNTRTKAYGVLDNKFRWVLAPGSYKYIGITKSGEYVEVTDGLKKNAGLYDLEKRRLIVPQEYEFVVAGGDTAEAHRGHTDDVYALDGSPRPPLPSGAKITDYSGKFRRYIVATGDPQPESCGSGSAGATHMSLTDTSGRMVLHDFREIRELYSADIPRFYVVRGARAGVVDGEGRAVTGMDFDPSEDPQTCRPVYVSENHAVLQQNGESVLVDLEDGKVVARGEQFGWRNPRLMGPEHLGGAPILLASRQEKNAQGREVERFRFLLNGKLYQEPGEGGASEDKMYLHDGMLGVKRDGKWGFLDALGREAIPFVYDDVRSFNGGTAYVKRDGNWSVINRAGQVLPHMTVELYRLQHAH